MDTRSKILTPRQAIEMAGNLKAAGRAVTVVTGWFDPLLAEHARLLGALAQPDAALMVVVHSPADPLLPARGRAGMVAALEMVDYVVLPEAGEPREWLAGLRADRIIREESSDARRTRELIRHVHARQ